MEPELADAELSVCGVLAQECANQIISNRKKKNEKYGCEIGLLGEIFQVDQKRC
jgi:hypothetical protein